MAVLPVFLAACWKEERVVDVRSVRADGALPATESTKRAAVSSVPTVPVPVSAIAIDAPVAGDAFQVSAYRLDVPGRDQRFRLRRTYRSSDDIAPLVKEALDGAFTVDAASPYRLAVKMIPSYTIYIEGLLDFTHEIIGKSVLFVTLEENGAARLDGVRYAGLSEGEHSTLDGARFPPPEMLVALLRQSLVEVAGRIAADPKLDAFRP